MGSLFFFVAILKKTTRIKKTAACIKIPYTHHTIKLV